MAYSVAYYSKLGGIRSTIFVSRNANWLKIRNIRETRDANIHRVDGDFTEAQRRAISYARRRGAFLVGDYGYRKEGQKTLIYEVLAELPDVKNVLIPVGNATLFSASYKGLTELQRCGLVRSAPRLIAVQASLTDPLAVAFKTGRRAEVPEARHRCWGHRCRLSDVWGSGHTRSQGDPGNRCCRQRRGNGGRKEIVLQGVWAPGRDVRSGFHCSLQEHLPQGEDSRSDQRRQYAQTVVRSQTHGFRILDLLREKAAFRRPANK